MDPIPLFTLDLFLKVLAAILAAALVVFVVIFAVSGSVSPVDIGGALVCAPIAAYLLHLWVMIFRRGA